MSCFTEDCAVIVNSHSSYHDVLEIFLKTFHEHCSFLKLYIFTDHFDSNIFIGNENVILYEGETFRDQYLFALKSVEEKYVLTLNDDYFIYGKPSIALLNFLLEQIEEKSLAQIRLHRGPNFTKDRLTKNLFKMDLKKPFFYSQTATLWELEALRRLFEATRPSGIARKGNELQFEVLANKTAQRLHLTGAVYFDNERKRGKYHYDCSIFPYIASAIVDGKWNFLEYPDELNEINFRFNCDLSFRGNNATPFSRFLEPIYAHFKRLTM